MGVIRGSVTGATKWIGYHVRALFEVHALLDGIPTEPPIWLAGGESVDLAGDGSFTLSLPDALNPAAPITVSVIAPTGALAATQDFPAEPPPIEITISAAAIGPAILGPTIAPAPTLQPLAGRVLDTRGKVAAANLQVLVWARAAAAPADDFTVVASARTDRAGYFRATVSAAAFVEAYGVVGELDDTRQPIPLVAGNLPATVVLVVDVTAQLVAKTGCACDSPVPRAPDPLDLVRSPESFSDDIGGGRCVDFTTPNRTIEEYSYYTIVRTTEPTIRAGDLKDPPAVPTAAIKLAKMIAFPALGVPNNMATEALMVGSPEISDTAALRVDVLANLARDPDGFTPMHLATAVRTSALDQLRDVLSTLSKVAPGRAVLNGKHPVEWEDVPLYYQATTVAHGHILHLKQIWRADGYSLGDLLYSLPLAPCQKKQIVIIDWARDDTAAESQRATATEALSNELVHARDVNEVVATALRESLRGGSSAGNWGIGGGLGAAAGGTLGFISGGAVLGIAGGGGSSSSSSWQDSTRDVSGSSLQQLRDLTQQSAAAVRSQRSTVIRTTRQHETVTVESDVVHNHNHCHAVTMEYFEVLRHMYVTQELVDVQECLFVPLMMTRFDPPKALRWRTTLEPNLMVPALVPGFGAIDRITSGDAGDLPDGRYEDELVDSVEGELTVSFHLARPKDDLEKYAEKAGYDPSSWLFYSPLLGLNPFYFFTTYLQRAADRDAAFQTYVAPTIAQTFVQGLTILLVEDDGTTHPAGLHATLLDDYVPGARLTVTLRPDGTPPGVARARIRRIRIWGNNSVGPESKAIVHGLQLRYHTAHMDHDLAIDPQVDDDLGTGTIPALPDTAIPTVPVEIPALRPDAEERRDPHREDIELQRRLLDHLNERIEHYHRVLWWNMDPQRRFMLLDGFRAPGSDGRSLASVVENRLLAIVGNSLVMPVARGFKLDPTYESRDGAPINLVALYQPTMPIDPMRVSLPTAGVFAEAVMGACNSCEQKDDTRFWRFEESPCGDEPTPIQPPSTDTRRADPGSLQPQAFPAPMINLQTAAPAPDPTGLAEALRVLGTANLFRDAAGLDQTQKNALAAMQAALTSAQQFSGQAASLASGVLGGKVAQQQQAAGTIDKTMQSIKQAQSDGLLSQGQASGLADSALRQMVGAPSVNGPLDLQTIKQAQDAGLIDPAQASALANKALSQLVAPTALTDNPTIDDALRSAIEGGRDIAVTSGGDSVTVSGLAATAPSVTIAAAPPFATTPLDFASLGLTRSATLLAKLAPVAKPIPAAGLGVIDLATKEVATINGATALLGASICKLAVAIAAYRLRAAVRGFAALSTATTQGALIKEISTVWKPVVGVAGNKIINPDFPKLDRILTFTLGASGWAIDFVSTPSVAFLPAWTVPGAVFVDPDLGFRERMQLMIEVSNNAAATACIDDLGFHYLNGAMIAEGFAPKAGLMMWVGSYYPPSNKQVMAPPVAGGYQSTTADALIMLIAALEQGALVDASASSELKARLAASGTWMRQQIDAGAIPSTFAYGKDALGEPPKGAGDTRSDLDVCTKPSGKRYGAAIAGVTGAPITAALIGLDAIF